MGSNGCHWQFSFDFCCFAPGASRDWPRRSCMARTKRLKVVSRNLTQWGLGNASDIAETSGHVHGVRFVFQYCSAELQAMAAP